MLGRFLDPKNSFAFKRIFGTEKNKDILIHFLNDVIEFGEKARIEEVTFLKPAEDPNIRVNKVSIVDVLCKDQRGNRYIVELQVGKEKGFEKRAQYYASKAYTSQMDKNGKFHHLKAVIFVAIADFIMFPNKKEYKSDHVFLDTNEDELKNFSFTFLELPKFNKTIDELSNTTEIWLYFFKHAEETTIKDLKKLSNYDEIMERAYDEIDYPSWNEEELLTYNQVEKYEAAYFASLEQKFDEGRAVGLLTRGVDIQEIEKITGLSRADILHLKIEKNIRPPV